MSINVQVSPSPNVNISVGAGGNLLNLTPQGYTLHANTHISGGIDAIDHNLLRSIQGGQNNEYYHLSSGEYFNLVTGQVIRPNQTGQFYSSSNPSGYISGINNLVFTTGNQTISGAKTFANNLTVNGGDLFVNTSNNRVGINTTSPTATLDVNGSGIFRSGLFVDDINAGSSNLNIRGLNTVATFGGIVTVRGGSGLLIGGPVTLEGGNGNSIGGKINIYGGSNGNIPNGSIDIQSTNTTFNSSNTYSSNVVFYKTGSLSFINNVRISQDSVLINNNLLITGNRPTVNSTGILLSGEATTQAYVTGISGGLQTQISTLNNQTGDYALKSNTGSFLTTGAADNRYVSLNGDQTIYNTKTFSNDVYINRLFVTGSETIASTTVSNIQSPYIILNLTGGATDGGMFFITGAGLTGINDTGPIIGFDHSDKFKFGVSTRASDLSTLATIGSVEQITGLSGYLQPQITTLNNQTGSYYPRSNPSGFITGVNLSSYATTEYVTGISGNLQTQINSLVEDSNTIIALSIFL